MSNYILKILSLGLVVGKISCMGQRTIFDSQVTELMNQSYFDRNSSVDLTYQPVGHHHLNFGAMIPVLVCLEVVCFILLGLLFYLANNALSQYKAEQDKILKSHAGFLTSYLLIKSLTTLVYILHYQGTLPQGNTMISCITFFNDISMIAWNVGCSLILFKWLVIINRVYFFSGNITRSRFRHRGQVYLYLYVFFVIFANVVHLVFIGQDLVSNLDLEVDGKQQIDIEMIPSFVHSVYYQAILSALTVSFLIIGSFLVNRLRRFFRDEYYKHSKSIIWSILMVTLSILAMMACQILKIQKREYLVQLEHSSLASGSWAFPLVYLGLTLLGDYFPIAAQIACIYIAIIGNWNELFQSELTTPDDTISINTHMFQEIAKSRLSLASQDSFRSKILDKFFDQFEETDENIDRQTTRASQYGTRVSSKPETFQSTKSLQAGENLFLPFTPNESTIWGESVRQSRASTLTCDVLHEDLKDRE